jgi:hypothetical protein
LLLAFSIVVLGTQEPPLRPAIKPASTPITPSARPALERKYVKVQFTVVPSATGKERDRRTIRAIRRAIQEKPKLKGRKAGIVLAFGAQVSGGDRLAHYVNSLLDEADKNLFADIATRDFHHLQAPAGQVELNIYLFYKVKRPKETR